MNTSYYLSWKLARLVYSTYFRWRVCNPERVPLTGPVIMASNHASYFDPPLVGAGVKRQFCFMGRESLFRFPLVGAYLKSLESIPVDRDGGSASGLRVVLDRLEKGKGIVLFPEGTRTRDGQLQKARSGVGLVAMKSGAPVVPVRVFGTFEAYGRSMKFPRPVQLTVSYGHPMPFTELRAEAENCAKARQKEIYQEVSDEILKAISRLQPFTEKSTFP